MRLQQQQAAQVQQEGPAPELREVPGGAGCRFLLTKDPIPLAFTVSSTRAVTGSVISQVRGEMGRLEEEALMLLLNPIRVQLSSYRCGSFLRVSVRGRSRPLPGGGGADGSCDGHLLPHRCHRGAVL